MRPLRTFILAAAGGRLVAFAAVSVLLSATLTFAEQPVKPASGALKPPGRPTMLVPRSVLERNSALKSQEAAAGAESRPNGAGKGGEAAAAGGSTAKEAESAATPPRLAKADVKKDADEAAALEGALVLDYVVASVKDDPITLSDLRRYASIHGEGLPETIDRNDPEVMRVLKSMVLDELVRREANSMGIAVTEDEVKAYINEIKQQNGVDEEGLRQILREKGMSLEEYLTQIRTDIIRTRVLGARVRPKVRVLEEEVQKKARERSKSVTIEKGAKRIHQIVVRELDPEDGRKRAQELREKLVEGESWSDVGGAEYADLGAMKPSDLRDELREAVEGLGDGEVSEPVEIDGTFYLVGVTGVDGESGSLSEADTADVKRELSEEQFKKAVEEFLTVELPSKYDVQYKL